MIDIIDPLDAYQITTSLKAHFTTQSYDYNKFGLNERRFTPESYVKRYDRHVFNSIAQRYQTKSRLIPLCISNFVLNPDITMHDLCGDDARKRYLKFIGAHASIVSTFDRDCDLLTEVSPVFYNLVTGQVNEIIRLMMKQKISPLTACTIDRICTILNTDDRFRFEESFVQKPFVMRLRKMYSLVPNYTKETFNMCLESFRRHFKKL